jgi:hypothetical protein
MHPSRHEYKAAVRDFVDDHNLPPELAKEVWDYFVNSNRLQQTSSNIAVLNCLPSNLQDSIQLHLKLRWIACVPFLLLSDQGLDANQDRLLTAENVEFLLQLLPACHVLPLGPNTVVIPADFPMSAMYGSLVSPFNLKSDFQKGRKLLLMLTPGMNFCRYIVKEGVVRIQGKYVSWGDGEYFGEQFLLQCYAPPRAYVTTVWTDVIRVNAQDLFDLLKSDRFPRIAVRAVCIEVPQLVVMDYYYYDY